MYICRLLQKVANNSGSLSLRYTLIYDAFVHTYKYMYKLLLNFVFTHVFQVGRCGYTWDATPALPMNIAKRVIRLGVYMPPWRTPSIMLVNLHPKMSLTGARDFINQLQNHVPQMQYHRGQNSTVL